MEFEVKDKKKNNNKLKKEKIRNIIEEGWKVKGEGGGV